MDRRTLLLGGLGALLPAAAFLARAQTATRPPRVVMILGGDEDGVRPFMESFLDGMREAGQVQGRTVQIDIRFGDRDPARVRALIVKASRSAGRARRRRAHRRAPRP